MISSTLFCPQIIIKLGRFLIQIGDGSLAHITGHRKKWYIWAYMPNNASQSTEGYCTSCNSYVFRYQCLLPTILYPPVEMFGQDLQIKAIRKNRPFSPQASSPRLTHLKLYNIQCIWPILNCKHRLCNRTCLNWHRVENQEKSQIWS